MDERLHDLEQRVYELEKMFCKNKEEAEYKKYLVASQSKKTLDAISLMEQPKENVILRKESKSFHSKHLSMWPMKGRK